MYDCRACGACCFSSSDEYVEVGSEEARRLQRVAALVRWSGERAYLRMEGGRCAGLAPDARGWSCTLYEQRPRACRALLPGSAACLEERAAKKRIARADLEAARGEASRR